jgi:hypothetical protein
MQAPAADEQSKGRVSRSLLSGVVSGLLLALALATALLWPHRPSFRSSLSTRLPNGQPIVLDEPRQ